MPSTPKLARYQVLGRLATGGMAEVWLGRALGFGGFEKLVVLKTILPNLVTNPQFVQMFINEARVAAMLNHPNCVQIFELGKEDDVLYIAMEYIEGFSLSRVLKRAKAKGEKVGLDVIARIAADALSGLEYAHRLTDREGKSVGLIHRDVSPDNLLLSFAGQTKLVDFGIAKASLNAAQQTRAGTVKGKFGYIAPEYLRGQAIDGRADLFALGVVLYRAVTGKRPFVGPSEAAVSLAVLRDEPVWPTEIDGALPQAMSAVVMMALEKQPDARFASAKAMRQAIEAAVRPADSEDVGALLNRLWPPGDPERVALETLAAGRAEEMSEPLLESVVSSGFELPEGVRATPHASVLEPEPPSDVSGATPPLPMPAVAPPSVLGPEPTTGATVVEKKVPVHPASVAEQSDELPRRRSPLVWVVLGLSVLAGGGLVWKLKAAASKQAGAGEAKAAKGRVRVEVDLPVTVVRGDVELGKAPGTFELEPGPVKLLLKGQGVEQTFELDVKPGQTANITELRKGTLAVKVEPWAYVKIDGRPAGQTPVRRELYEGPHTVELSNTELNITKRLDVTVKGGDTRQLSVKLE
ncbi:MAG: serine/threonine protein kinase [Myxococcaceae bacterium]|nr:serine/threonine protein kinase [Myxococcaceae bacterium]